MRFAEHPVIWDNTKVSRLWDYYSKNPHISAIYFSKVYGKYILKASKLPLRKKISVLDFGCGPGFIWEHILTMRATWNYTGLDFSSESVRIIREKAAGHSQFFGGVHLGQLPSNLPDNHYDVVLLLEVIEHVNDEYLGNILLEIRRVLKYGGVLVITTPNEEDLSLATKYCPDCGAIFHEWQHVRSWNSITLTKHLTNHNFAKVLCNQIDFAAQGVLRRIATWAKGVVTKQRKKPHLIAVFQKN
jgi:2-polyprenyl-3-methyl-5-hydroxy-6-metoxy-1,4-benzoquinol methylase